MLAFGVRVTDPATFERVCAAGLRACAEDGAPVLTTDEPGPMAAAYNQILDAVAAMDGVDGLVLLGEDVEIRDPLFTFRVTEALAAHPRAALGVHSPARDGAPVDGRLIVLAGAALRDLRFDPDDDGPEALLTAVRRAGVEVRGIDLDVGFPEASPAEAPALAEVAATAAPPADATVAGVHSAESHAAGYFDHARDELTRHLPATARRVLDVGCGAGALGASVKTRTGAEVVGIEYFEDAAARAAERLDRVIRADLNTLAELPYPHGHFDAMFFGDVLEHLLDPARTLAALTAYLAPDGVVIASIPNVKHWSVLLPLLVNDAFTYTDAGLLDRTHVHLFTLNEAAAMFRAVGLGRLESVESVVLPGDEADLSPLVGCAAAFGADPDDTLARLRTYQYVVVARRGGHPAP